MQSMVARRRGVALETKDAAGADGGDAGLAEVKAAFAEHDKAVGTRIAALEQKLTDHSKRADLIETAMNRPGSDVGGGEEKAIATRQEKAFTSFLRRGADSLAPDERKDLTVGENVRGGYLAPTQFANEIIKNLVQTSPMRAAARVGSMTAEAILIPKRTERPTARWVGETELRPETNIAYGQARIPANEMAAFIDVSQQLLEDSAFSIEAEISADMAEEFGRLEGEAFITGSGVNKPLGILSDPAVPSVASGSASTLTADSLIDILYALPAFYRNQATWMMNSGTLVAIRKMKDGQGKYLWQPGLAAGQPATILGRPVIDAVDMPDIAAGTTPIVVGAMGQAYRIFDRVGTSVLRDPFTLATQGLVRFHCRRRVGGSVVKAEAVRKLKIAVS